MSLSTSYLKIKPMMIAVVVDYIVGMAFANHPIDFTLRAYELAAGGLFPILTRHYLLKRAVSTAGLNTNGTL